MKSLRILLFTLLVPACGDRETPTAARPLESFLPTMSSVTMPEPIALPVPSEEMPAAPSVAISEPAPPTKADDALVDGRAAESKGDHARAIELFDAAAKLDKKRAQPHIELARVYITTGQRGLAIAAANKAVKLAPESSLAWNTKGRAELARFDYDAAIDAFTKSVDLDRTNVWAWNNLGFAELALKKYDAAAEHLAEATSRAGATGYMWNNYGTALEQLDRLDDARVAYDQGGKLGSIEAASSKKRLQGVESLALAKPDPDDAPSAHGAHGATKKDEEVHTYSNTEGDGEVDAGAGAGSGSGSAEVAPVTQTN